MGTSVSERERNCCACGSSRPRRSITLTAAVSLYVPHSVCSQTDSQTVGQTDGQTGNRVQGVEVEEDEGRVEQETEVEEEDMHTHKYCSSSKLIF